MLIAPAPAGLLVIGFKALGRIFMDHKTHIRFTNTHAKSICRNNDAGAVGLPVLLPFGALLHSEAGVIEIGAKTVLIIKFCYLGGLFPAAYINNSAAFYASRYVEHLAQLVFFILHHVA